MKKLKLFITCFSCLLSFALFAQWEWQNPYPQGYDLNDVQFLDSQIGWAVGDKGTIIKTTDGGISWEILNSGTNENLIQINVIDINVLWIVSSACLILNTNDGGDSWTQIAFDNTDELINGFFLEGGKGWIIGKEEYAYTIFHTSNGGISWDIQVDDTTFLLRKIFFLNENTGWVLGEKYDSIPEGIVLHTINGGESWELHTFPYTYMEDIIFTDSENGWIVGHQERIIFTSDGGVSWTTQFWNEYGYIITGVDFIDSSYGWVAGYDILEGCNKLPFTMYTIDGGETWSERLWVDGIYCYSSLSDICFTDFNNGWVVGSDGIIGCTNDGGNTWESQSGIYTPATLKDIIFIDELNGWAIGDHIALPSIGMVIKSTNGGFTWELQDLLQIASIQPNSLDFLDVDHGWIVGRTWQANGRIIYTNDGGENWIESYTLEGNSLNGICSIDQNNCWVVGDNGSILYYNGIAWTEQSSSSTNDLLSVYFIDANKGWTVGNEGTIMHTSDGGINWATQTSGTTIDLKDVIFIDSYNGWIAGGYSIYSIGTEAIILHTNNGGTTWETQLADTSFQLTGIAFAEDQTGWAVGSGIIYKTTNGGDIWEVQNSGIDHYGLSVHFIDNNIGWIAGHRGHILHTNNGGTAEVPKTKIPNFNPLIQIYPNPSSNHTTIEFTLSESEFVTLSIYNITGKHLKTILTKKLSKGDHKFNWNAEGLNEGVYFIRMETESAYITCKAIIMK